MSSSGAWRVARVELARSARQTTTYVTLGIVAVYSLVLTLGLAAALKAPPGQGFDANALLVPLRKDAVGFLADILSGIAVLVTVVFVSLNVGQEFSRGTLRTILLSRARRGDVVLGKLVHFALYVLVMGGIVAFASVGAAAALSSASGEALLQLTLVDALLLLARSWLALGLWAALGFGVALLVRSPGIAIGSTLAFLLVGDILRGLLLGLGRVGIWTSQALPNTAIAHATSSTRVPNEEWLWIVPNLVLWLGGLNAWAWLALRRMDVIAATK